MTDAFISYVSENRPAAEQIAETLESNHIKPWLDKNALKAGQRWHDEIRHAITNGSYFIPLFSKEWMMRDRSFANDELMIAIEELRRRPYNRSWIIPVKLDGSELPDIPIGGGQTINSLHYIDYSKMDRKDAFFSLLQALGIENPNLSNITDISKGWPFKINVFRNDRFVDNVPLAYFFNGKQVVENSDSNFTLTLSEAGRNTFYCSAEAWSSALIRTRGMPQGTLYYGISDKITENFLPGHSYELSVSGDNIEKTTIVSPYAELIKMGYRKVNTSAFDPQDQSRWPKIQLRLTHI